MASVSYEKITGTTAQTTRIRMTFTPNEAHVPVLVDFWRQDVDPNRDINEVWRDLTSAYDGAATISPTKIVQSLSGTT